MKGFVDPWGSIDIKDYSNLFKEFGLEKFSDNYKLDYYLFRRNLIVAHRDFGSIFQRIKKKKPFIQVTGIASSGRLHLGHKVDVDLFLFFKRFSRSYFAVSDIDAYVSRENIKTMDEAKGYAVRNVADLLALGLNKKDIYVQSNKERRYYEFAFEISKRITRNTLESIYGPLDLGKVSANLLQYADILHPQLREFNGRMPSLTCIGLEQDPHAKAVRDIARRTGMELPSFLYFMHQSGLQKGMKMSSSEPDTAIFLDDNEKQVTRKIDKTFTGGRDTVEEQKRLGGRPGICKVFEIYKFHHPDDKFVEETRKRCESGKLLCGEDKGICKRFLIKMLKGHQKISKKFLKTAEKIVFG